MRFLITLTTLLIISSSYAQITGTWKTYDDKSKKARSTVYIYKAKNGKYYGKVKSLLIESEKGQKCVKCTGDKKNKPIEGMVIISGLQKDGNEYDDGTILDPEDGKVYDCKIWKASNGDLKVRGYWGWFYRTQTWKKVK